MNKEQLQNLGLLILRIPLGVIFLAHGLQKLAGVFGGAGIEGTTRMMQGLGFAPPEVWAWILASGETIGGFFLILGILPRLSSTVISVIIVVAIGKVHAAKGFFMSQGGYEYQMMLLGAALSIILTGSGKYSLLDKG